ncbi:D-mannonate oxidoreductase [Salmonella enterica subsp. enterica]|uniref:D-mannonate oxidoreductase n=1 Tax=Salmonella enterica I TaxID=59201 RepID=A0A447MT19_SALET|nr:D-mannonate oxidoreductase [Salmonella enterica subsp. enterica]
MQNRLLSAKATLPDYDRAALAARMVHLGFGAFHRAHQGGYTDILAAEQHSDWGYYEVNLIGGEQQIADLKQQDNLYTVAEMSAEAWTARVVGVVKAALHVQVDGLERVLAGDVRTANSDCVSDHYRERVLSFASHGANFCWNIP